MVKPLFWHQGLFLQPHHFQLDDLYTRSLMEPLYRFMVPHFWGVGSFEIEESSLSNYIFDIKAGEFLFPDNSHVIIGENGVIQARSFEKAWEDGGKKFSVFLGLKKWNDTGENVSVLTNFNDLADVSTRFVSSSVPEEIGDLHGNGPSAEVKRMNFLIKIFWENEIDYQGDYQLIEIAKLKKNLDEIVVSDEFIPPCLTITGSEILNGVVKEVREQISSRTRQLEAVKRSKGVHTAEFGSRDMVYMLALRSLNRYAPLLTHLTAANQSSPWTVYGIMRQIIGELSSFSAEISAGGELEDGTVLLSEYDHKNLWECFTGAQKLITRLLDGITSGPEYIIPMHFDGTYFIADLSPGIFEGKNSFFLVMESESDTDTLVESMKNIAKLSSRESLPILIAQSLPGVTLNFLEIPPQELPRRTGSIYFQIDHHGKQWDHVKNGNNLALYWDRAPDDFKVELMVVRRH